MSGLLILLNVLHLKAWAFCYCLHFDCLGNHIKGMIIFMWFVPWFGYVLLKKCLQLRKNINYKQGWGYSKLRCSPEHSQPKDMGIFCLLGWLQMIELLFQTLYNCYLLASVSGLLILLNVLF